MSRLAAEMPSTMAKPSTIFPRNRKVGSFRDADCDVTRFKPTHPGPPFQIPSISENAGVPNPLLKREEEWIKSRKYWEKHCHDRHCEDRSDEAIQSFFEALSSGARSRDPLTPTRWLAMTR
ncbi:MAG TPA: hypothetical protein VGO49_08580 [Bradyrhizobium sp.]|jgi:hypothetical protein|nr:hypothetical protein [Bradyrhizobium sp.]